jgi:hypothetical protein
MMVNRDVTALPTSVVTSMWLTHVPLRRNRNRRQSVRSRLPVRNLLVRVTQLGRIGWTVDHRVRASATGFFVSGPSPLLRPISVVGDSLSHDRNLRRSVPPVIRRQNVVVGVERPFPDRFQTAVMLAHVTVPRTRRTDRATRTLRCWTVRTVVLSLRLATRQQESQASKGKNPPMDRSSLHDIYFLQAESFAIPSKNQSAAELRIVLS